MGKQIMATMLLSVMSFATVPTTAEAGLFHRLRCRRPLFRRCLPTEETCVTLPSGEVVCPAQMPGNGVGPLRARALQNQINALNDDVLVLEGTVGRLRAEAAELRGDVAELRGEVEELKPAEDVPSPPPAD